MNSFLPVMIGGALGAGLRYGVGLLVAGPVSGPVSGLVSGRFPWATLGVNLVGGFLMGLLMAFVLKGSASEGIRLFAGVGILGGFTTFSAFSLDMLQMLERGQSGLALGYAAASVVGSIILLALGLSLGKAI
jgi:fluoride exporter